MATKYPEATAPTSAARQIEITKWRAHVKETCRGFFSAMLPSGMILHDLILREKGDARWINFPSRAYEGSDGKQHYADYIDFVNDETRNRFRDQVLTALDDFFAHMPK